PPPGGLVLTIYDRPLGRGEKGQYRLPEGRDWAGFRTHAPHGQRSSLWLMKEESQSLIPANPRKGQAHKMPAKLFRRLCLYGMWPQTLWVVEQAWQPDSLREGGLTLTVEEVSERTVRLRLDGSVLLSGKGPLKLYPTGKVLKMVENRYDARLAGVMVYNRRKKGNVKRDMASLGGYAGCWFAGNAGWEEAKPETP